MSRAPHAAALAEPDPLLTRIRAGDREAAAAFVLQNQALIRRRYRHKVGSALRRLIDSEDLVATLSRRLDAYILSGRLQAVTLDQLWALIHRIVENSVSDKGRLLQRLRRAEAEDISLATAIGDRIECQAEAGEDGQLWALLESVHAPVDREIVSLWLADVPLKVIAQQLGMTEENARKRWQRIRKALRERLTAA